MIRRLLVISVLLCFSMTTAGAYYPDDYSSSYSEPVWDDPSSPGSSGTDYMEPDYIDPVETSYDTYSDDYSDDYIDTTDDDDALARLAQVQAELDSLLSELESELTEISEFSESDLSGLCVPDDLAADLGYSPDDPAICGNGGASAGSDQFTLNFLNSETGFNEWVALITGQATEILTGVNICDEELIKQVGVNLVKLRLLYRYVTMDPEGFLQNKIFKGIESKVPANLKGLNIPSLEKKLGGLEMRIQEVSMTMAEAGKTQAEIDAYIAAKALPIKNELKKKLFLANALKFTLEIVNGNLESVLNHLRWLCDSEEE